MNAVLDVIRIADSVIEAAETGNLSLIKRLDRQIHDKAKGDV